MGLFLIAAGMVFVDYLWGSYRRSARMDNWVEVPCRIEAVTIDESGRNQRGLPKYELQVSYRFQWQGQDFLGTRLRRLPEVSSDRRKLEKDGASYPVGTEAICHLDPDAPELAVLKKDSKAALYSIWFPCLFVVGGVGMVWSGVFVSRNPTRHP